MNGLVRNTEATPHSGQRIHERPTYVELKQRDIERLSWKKPVSHGLDRQGDGVDRMVRIRRPAGQGL